MSDRHFHKNEYFTCYETDSGRLYLEEHAEVEVRFCPFCGYSPDPMNKAMDRIQRNIAGETDYSDPMRELTPFLVDQEVTDEFLDECVQDAQRDFSEIRAAMSVPAPSAIQMRAERMILLVAEHRRLEKELAELHAYTHDADHVFDPECRLCCERDGIEINNESETT